jgi:hypothetical protein
MTPHKAKWGTTCQGKYRLRPAVQRVQSRQYQSSQVRDSSPGRQQAHEPIWDMSICSHRCVQSVHTAGLEFAQKEKDL